METTPPFVLPVAKYVVVVGPSVIPPAVPVNHGEKSEKFNGTEFKRWQQKMLFYLTTLNLVRFLNESAPVLTEEMTTPDRFAAVDAWNHADFLCRNYIFNGLDNILYNVYSPMKTAKELWDSLDKKSKTEDAGIKKFVIGKFLEYMMIDSKSVISQVQEIQLILHDIHAEGMSIGESFQVAAIIEKLPPGWKEFKNYFKHKRKEMKLEELIICLRIEEDNRNSDRKGKNPMVAKSNVVEHGGTSNLKKRKHTGQGSKQGPKVFGNKKAKFQGKCFKYDKIGHRATR